MTYITPTCARCGNSFVFADPPHDDFEEPTYSTANDEIAHWACLTYRERRAWWDQAGLPLDEEQRAFFDSRIAEEAGKDVGGEEQR